MVYKVLLSCLTISAILDIASADVYAHNPGGCNNRWNENGRARQNAKRLFDSENNDRGGYNLRKLYYYVGSILDLEWTNQHSCGNENNHCEMVIQYTCGDYVRDGTTTSTIPDDPRDCENNDCNRDLRYGMHEDFYSYQHCRLRSRNKGLYTAQQNLKKDGATYSRQNSNGQRYAYECTEERDYYPNAHPSIWKDIVVFTNNVSRCEYYQSESQNVKERSYCKVDESYLWTKSMDNNVRDYIPITQEACESFVYEVTEGETVTQKNATWVTVPSHGIEKPDCLISPYGRDNHNGNGPGGQFHSYRWIVPNDPNENCVMRFRYNISTGDFPRDGVFSDQNNRDKQISRGPDIRSVYGLGTDEGADRGYEITNNPKVQVFSPLKYPELADFKLQHAVNTAQYGRVFQDRTHTFAIRERTEDIPAGASIININVRGKRGNIVQVYPAVEYDFTPNQADIPAGAMPHFQWSGSNNNPNNNDGQGRQGTDRSNVILMKKEVYQEGEVNPPTRYGAYGRSYPAHIDDNVTFLGLPRDVRHHLGILDKNQFGGDMSELDAAGTYFDAGPQSATSIACYHYMCTRNNNFSNRSQKGKICVIPSVAVVEKTVDNRGGSLRVQRDVPMAAPLRSDETFDIEIPPNALDTQSLSMSANEIPPADACKDMAVCPEGDKISNFVVVEPQGPLPLVTGKTIEVKMKVDDYGSLYEPIVWATKDNGESWQNYAITSTDGKTITFHTYEGAAYVVSKSLLVGSIAALSIGLLAGVLLLVAIIVMYKKNSMFFSSYGDKI